MIDAKYLPVPDVETRPYWDAARARELRVQRCKACGEFRWPPRGVCPKCFGWESSWEPVSGQAQLVSYVVSFPPPDVANATPLINGRVLLAELPPGHFMTTNVIDCEWRSVFVGMPLQVTFYQASDSFTLPVFRPA